MPFLSLKPLLCTDLPVNNDVLNKMMAEADLAGTGSIDFTGFVTMMSKKMKKVRFHPKQTIAYAIHLDF